MKGSPAVIGLGPWSTSGRPSCDRPWNTAVETHRSIASNI
jgi:hypothetical protein